MASGRFISVSVAEDSKLGKLSMSAEFLYLKSIPHLDRDGMMTGRPGLLWSKVCPLREELFGETGALIDEWVAVGLVVRFHTDEGPVLFFPGFAKNNNLPHYNRERPSRFPPPPGFTRTDKGLITDNFDPSTSGEDEVLDEVLESVNDEVLEKRPEDQDQEEDQEKAAARARACEYLPETDADKDGRSTMQLLRDTNLFFSFGADARQKASGMEEKYSCDTIRAAVDVLIGRHHKMVERNGKGIHDPLSFLGKILSEDFRTKTESERVQVEVRMVPDQYEPRERIKHLTMTRAEAMRQGYKIVGVLQ